MPDPIHHPTPASAQAFADRWYAAWNARDLDAIMACYEPTIEHSSPFIKRYNGTDETSLKGIDAVRDRGAERRRVEPKFPWIAWIAWLARRPPPAREGDPPSEAPPWRGRFI